MRFKNINEAVDLECPNCGENLGKDTENPKKAYCGNCGEDNIRNPRGYNESKTNEKLKGAEWDLWVEIDSFIIGLKNKYKGKVKEGKIKEFIKEYIEE